MKLNLMTSAIRHGLFATACITAFAGLPVSAAYAAPAQAAAVDVQSTYNARFMALYEKIKDPANGYFSPQGVPYHSVETLIVEAPDHGHETTSEAYSYWLWLEAMYGRISGDWAPFKAAWANMEKYIIPSTQDQPTNRFYQASKPATYAAEWDLPSQYPSPLQTGVPVGQDPIADELRSAYGTSDIYGMHWLLDVDNWYGYGRCGDGTTAPAYINTFQRGSQESVWETIPHPSCETFAWGKPGSGFLSLFTGDASYSRQWRYTNAPDADARAVQAAYWAHIWAKEQGKEAQVAEIVQKAAKMGDYLRYAMFDKYFKKVGECVGEYACPGASGKDSMHYLMSWYYAWGGAMDGSGGWAWRIGSSHNHFGYQNPLAAYVLSAVGEFKPKSATAAADWNKSLQRQIEFYTWLQSAEGAIAGGATNSWNGRHERPTSSSSFYGMYYDAHPVYHDPGSNQWFGFQAWSMQRVAEYYYVTGDVKAKAVLDKWVNWARQNTKLGADGSYEIPSTLVWSGEPDTWNPTAPGSNRNLHVSVKDFTTDPGVTAAYARTLMMYAAKSGNAAAKTTAKELLDRMWARYQTDKGVSAPEKREDYKRFDDRFDAATGDGVFVPAGWNGINAQGAKIDASSTFLSIRPKYTQDPNWPKVQRYLNGGPVPEFTYHRFWAQADIALAMADYDRLFSTSTPVQPKIVASRTALTVNEGSTASFGVKLSAQPSANVTVAVKPVAGGDPDLSVRSGASLLFTPQNWSAEQAVTLAAAPDADTENGRASFSLSAVGLDSVGVIATEVDGTVIPDPIALQVDTVSVSVRENGSASFRVRLSRAPAAALQVTVQRQSGDGDLTVRSGASLSFNAGNWGVYQTVTLAAAPDADTVNGSASFSVAAAGLASLSVRATEIDTTQPPVPVKLQVESASLTVREGGTAGLRVRLATAPSAPVLVSVRKQSGDADLTVQSGASLTFSPSNWSAYQTAILSAREDSDTLNGSAVFAVSASGATPLSVNAVEADNDPIQSGACKIVYDGSNDWGSGFVGRVQLTNSSNQAVNGWKVSWTAANDFTLGSAWSGEFKKDGRTVQVTPLSWNTSIPAQGTIEFGLVGNYSGAKPTPTHVQWEGRNCAVEIR